MRTISKNILLRLAAQADEADIWGDREVADYLTMQIEKHASNVRPDNADYIYTQAELEAEVKQHLWDIATTTQDFYNKTADAKELGILVRDQFGSFMESLEHLIGKHVGPYEPKTPGEDVSEMAANIPATTVDEDEGEDEDSSSNVIFDAGDTGDTGDGGGDGDDDTGDDDDDDDDDDDESGEEITSANSPEEGTSEDESGFEYVTEESEESPDDNE